MISFPLAFIAFVVGFGFLVFIHELGHFLVAKWVGIRCTQFAVGFGPAILSWRKGMGVRIGSTEPGYFGRAAESLRQRGIDPESATQEQAVSAADELGLGETEYRLNYLPLGGYVKMMGQEDMDPAARSDDPRSFNSKSVAARFAVISAGVIMNLITGVVFFVIAFMAGVRFPPAIVGGVVPDMPAATTYAAGHEADPAYRGLQPGDHITHIDDDPITDLMAVKLASALGAADVPVTLTIERQGEPRPLIYRMTPKVDPQSQNLQALGIAAPRDTIVGTVREDAPVYEAGLREGMKLVSVQGEAVSSYASFVRRVNARRGEPTPVTFADPRTGKQVTVPLSATALLPIDERSGANHVAGLVPATRVSTVVENSPAQAAGIRAGDILAELGGTPWPSIADVIRIVKDAQGRPVHVVVQRDGQLKTIGSVNPNRDDQLGIRLALVDRPIIGGAIAETSAAALNLPGGSVLRSVNGQAVKTWSDAMRILSSKDAAQPPVTVTIEYELNLADRPVEQAQLTLDAETIRQIADAAWLPPTSVGFEALQEPVEADTPWEATVLGMIKTKEFILQGYVTIVRLTQGSVPVESLRGPIGILDEGTQITTRGWSYYFFFLGLLSVNLAVINFLPIPIADGGHAVFLLAEKIKGSPVNPKIQIAAMYVGLVLIGGLFLLVTYHDLRRIF